MLPPDWLPQIKAAYPMRKGAYGWYDLKRHMKARIADFSWDDIIEGTKRFRKFAVEDEIWGTCFVMQPVKFYGRGCYFTEDWATDIAASPQMTLDAEAEDYGLVRADGESDESLKHRLGIAQTMKIHKIK